MWCVTNVLNFQIVIEGRKRADAFLALDNIELVGTSCSNLGSPDIFMKIKKDNLRFSFLMLKRCFVLTFLIPDLQTCESRQFKCRGDKSCIPESLVCNGQYDCSDGSDESPNAGCNSKTIIFSS